jgi:hypothetical protein
LTSSLGHHCAGLFGSSNTPNISPPQTFCSCGYFHLKCSSFRYSHSPISFCSGVCSNATFPEEVSLTSSDLKTTLPQLLVFSLISCLLPIFHFTFHYFMCICFPFYCLFSPLEFKYHKDIHFIFFTIPSLAFRVLE